MTERMLLQEVWGPQYVITEPGVGYWLIVD